MQILFACVMPKLSREEDSVSVGNIFGSLRGDIP